jgi:hypothetical protein
LQSHCHDPASRDRRRLGRSATIGVESGFDGKMTYG